MAAFIRAKVSGIKAFNKKMDRMSPEKNTSRLKRDPLLKGALEVQKIAVTDHIIRGGAFKTSQIGVAAAAFSGSGSTRNLKVDPIRLTSRTGALRRSIRVNRDPLPHAIEIGTDLGYGAIHEFGLGRFPKRPFMTPALKDAERKIRKFFEDALRRENRKR